MPAKSAESRVQIPECLAHLPRHGHLPIPFFSAINPDGTPNFRAHDPKRHNRAMAGRLCGVCGRALDYWIAFVMGENSLPLRDSYMPPFHRACAVASMQLCPWLALETRPRPEAAEHLQLVPFDEMPPKPKRCAIALTRSYTTFDPGVGQLYAHFASPKEIAWWSYRNGLLTPEET